MTLKSVCLSLLLCFFSLVVYAEEPTYTIHEWGVFSFPRNTEWARIEMLSEWATFPKEFYGNLPARRYPSCGSSYKPVVFFHANAPMQIKLVVRYRSGEAMIWWPATSQAVRMVTSMQAVKSKTDTLVFSPHLIKRLPAPADEEPVNVPKEIKVDKTHWIHALRQVKASQVFCQTLDGWSDPWETENFIFYDGILQSPAAPMVSRDKTGLLLQTRSEHEWLDVIAIERNENGLKISEWTARIKDKSKTTHIKMSALVSKTSEQKAIGALRKQLLKRLTVAGLNKDEAVSMVNVWHQGIFEQDGLTLLYRIPQSTYDRWIALTATPKPASIVRVGLVLHRHMEPEFDTRMQKLVKELGDESFDIRTDTEETMLQIGGAAFGYLKKNKNNSDLEISQSCQRLLKILDPPLPLKKPVAK